MEPLFFILIFLVGLSVSSLTALTGGAGLVHIPFLIFLGIPPHIAIATNRLGAIGIMSGAWIKFHIKKQVNYKLVLLFAPLGMLGSIIGSMLLLEVNDEFLRGFIAFMTLAVLVLILLKRNIGIIKNSKDFEKKKLLLGVALIFFLGIYTGFYGAGAGTFFAYIMVLLLGLTFIENAATASPTMLFVTLVSAAYFIIEGIILYDVALALFLGNLAGAYVGAHYAERIGNVWIKRLFTVVVLVMVAKLLI
jgi:hypothetical protein